MPRCDAGTGVAARGPGGAGVVPGASSRAWAQLDLGQDGAGMCPATEARGPGDGPDAADGGDRRRGRGPDPGVGPVAAELGEGGGVEGPGPDRAGTPSRQRRPRSSREALRVKVTTRVWSASADPSKMPPGHPAGQDRRLARPGPGQDAEGGVGARTALLLGRGETRAAAPTSRPTRVVALGTEAKVPGGCDSRGGWVGGPVSPAVASPGC